MQALAGRRAALLPHRIRCAMGLPSAGGGAAAAPAAGVRRAAAAAAAAADVQDAGSMAAGDDQQQQQQQQQQPAKPDPKPNKKQGGGGRGAAISFSTDAKGSPFDELKLIQITEGMGKVRVRQHVNPLRAEYQQPIGPIDWASAFADPTLPLVVDLGCGPGRFLLLLERRAAAGRVGLGVPAGGRCNYLGIEIRRALVDRANEWARELGCDGRVHYVFANATVSLAGMLQGYPGQVEAFYVQFPDPHFKRRHRKRRILQPDTVRAMAAALRPGGLVFLQSDVLRAAEGMRDAVEEAASADFAPHALHAEPGRTFEARSPGGNADSSGGFADASGGEGAAASWEFGTVSSDDSDDARSGAASDDDGGGVFVSEWAKAGWLRDNPVEVPTEREYYVAETQGGDVYRVLLVKQ